MFTQRTVSVTNHLDTDSPPEVTRSPHYPLHHTTAAHHPRTAFPIHHCTNHICHQSLIALITQMALITHSTKALDLSSLTAEYCFATSSLSEPFFLFISVVDYLDCLLFSAHLLPAFLTLPAF